MRLVTGIIMMAFWVQYRSRKKLSTAAAAVPQRWVEIALEAQADYMRKTP